MQTVRLLASCALAVSALGGTAAVADAAFAPSFPTPKNKTIKAVKSIAGISLGMTYDQALATWGPGSSCQEEDEGAAANNVPVDHATITTSCTWRSPTEDGSAEVMIVKGKVQRVSLTGAQGKPGTPTTKGEIAKYTLKVGKIKITTGVSWGTVYRAYGNGKKLIGTGGGVAFKQGKQALAFSDSDSRLQSISLVYASDLN